MNFLIDSPYTKTTGISLFLHGALLGILFMLGPLSPIDAPPEITAVEVDIIPASVIDIGDMATALTDPAPSAPAEKLVPQKADPSPSAPAEKSVPQKAVQPTPSIESLPSAMQGETNGISVGNPVSSGTGTVKTAVVSGNNGSGANDSGGGESSANCLYGPKPTYPQAARKAGWEGAVVLRTLISTDGSVVSVSVREGSGYDELDEAAVQGVKKWRFSPAKKAGIPIASFHDVRVRFRLVDA
ncbi:MAG: hypothetical protein H6Q68_572 [Firmicutes bacterium]|nr:hypothetical protein [Bacillota bacterium]